MFLHLPKKKKERKEKKKRKKNGKMLHKSGLFSCYSYILFPQLTASGFQKYHFSSGCTNVNTKKAVSFVRLAEMNSGTSGQTLQNSIHKTVYDFLKKIMFARCQYSSNPIQFLHMSSSPTVLYCPPSSTGPLSMKTVLAAFMSTRHKLESFQKRTFNMDCASTRLACRSFS